MNFDWRFLTVATVWGGCILVWIFIYLWKLVTYVAEECCNG